MNNKPDQSKSSLWPAIIGVVGVIIGAALGYFGTRTNANAQIRVSQENANAQATAAREDASAQMTNVAVSVYGPIFATQTAEAKITPVNTPIAPNKVDTLAIEDIPQKVFVFAGNNSPDGGWGAFSVIYDIEHNLNYRMEYSLPEDKYGYAGMAFQFPKGYNLSEFEAIKFTILFRVPTDEMDLFIKDISDNNNSIHITGNGDEQMDLRFEFTNFSNINFNAVKEIGVLANTEFSTGSHEVWIKNVHFVK